MELFPQDYISVINLLPKDGIVENFGVICEAPDVLYQKLKNELSWKPDEVRLFGKTHITKRKVVWMGEKGSSYTYSGATRYAEAWTEEVLRLKKICEKTLAEHHIFTEFNSCLLNYYPSGQEGMGWHSDNESAMGKESIIASVSLGAERRFIFKHKKEGIKKELLLTSGQMIVMRGSTQEFWLHSLPKSVKVQGGRINLTFRKVLF